jgi:uncharacterized protein involved in exopolysaccharide biosynthesis
MNALNFELLLEMLCRRRAVALGVGLLVFGSIALGTIVWPPTYVSKGEILVQSNRAELLVSPGLQENYGMQPGASVSPVTEQDLNSEAELLNSSYLVEQALSGVPLHEDKGLANAARRVAGTAMGLPGIGYAMVHKAHPISPRQQWTLNIARHLSISLIKRSNVIEVSFSSHDPVWSREFLTLFLNHYLEFHARISNDPQAENFYQEQRALLNQRLSHSEELLRGLQLQTGISRVNEQKQALIAALYGSEADYRKTSSELAAVLEQIAALEAQLKHLPQRMTKEARVVQNLALSQIKAQVLQLETARAELLSRYQPTSARIVEIDAKLSAAKAILEHENRTEVQETTTDVNPTWSQLDSDLARAHAQAASLQAAQTSQTRQLEEIRKQLGNLTSDGVTIDRAQLQVDGDKEAYLSYVRKGEEARAARALNQNKILNVSVVENPTLALEPEFPRLGMNLAAGLVLAIVLGIGAAQWEESNDPKVCSTAAIAEAVGVPTIAVPGDGF